MEPHGFVNLGGRDKPVDSRDIKLGAAAAIKYSFPPTLSNNDAWHAPVEYQGQQPACGAHAGAAMKGIRARGNFTPRFTWADLKTFDGFPIADGTDMRSIFKSLTKSGGALPFSSLGNDVTLPLPSYAHPVLSTAQVALAAKNKGDGYGFITDLSFNGIKQFISDHGPSVLLFRVGSELWTAPSGQASWAEKDILPLRAPANIVGGHFVVVHSYDEQYIYFLNSFGNTWGRQGHGYFGADYMPFVNDVGTLFPLAFTHDLSFGMTDPDVKRLQVVLNKDPRTRVAASGTGSPGQETEFFGSLTQNALKRFQALYSITPAAGYCGPLTRAVLQGFL